MQFHSYLNFDGRCAEAFRYYAQVLGGKLEIMTYGDSPARDEVPEYWRDRVVHAALTVGDQLLMASDAPPDHYRAPTGTYVSVTVETAEEARRIFDAFAEGAQIQMPFDATFWSPGFGMLVDRWGTPWMVNTMPQPEAAATTQRKEAVRQ